jgi:hypothetical protein
MNLYIFGCNSQRMYSLAWLWHNALDMWLELCGMHPFHCSHMAWFYSYFYVAQYSLDY